MAITATVPQSANFAPKSTMAEGLNPAVIFAVEDLGLVPVSEVIIAKNRAQRQKEGGDPNSVKTSVHKARIFFNNSAGEFIAQDYTLSLHEKAKLSADLKRMGKAFDQSFDVETLVGTQVQLMNEEATSQRGTKYVKIAAIAKPAKGQNVKPLASVPTAQPAGQRPAAPPPDLGISDDDIPF